MPSFYESSLPQPETRSSSAPVKQPASLILLIALLLPVALAYLLVSGNETKIVAFLIAVLGGLIIIARPIWGLIVFVGLLYIRPEESIPALAGARLPLIISLVTMFALVFQKLLSRQAMVRTPLNGMIIGFGISVVLSSFVSDTTATAALDISRLVTLVLLILNLADSPKRYRMLITAVIVFTSYLAAYSIHLYFSGGALVQGATLLRSQATGIFGDPNDLAATIIAGLGLTLVRMRQAASISSRLVYLAISALLIAAVLLTESRGGMLALLTILGIFTYHSSRNKPLAITMAIVIVLAFLGLKGGRMTTFDSAEESANSRFWFWSNGTEQLMNHPLLGVGYGGFPDINGGMTAHNTFVLCFAETGLIGYFFWMGCVYYAFRRISPEEAPAPDKSISPDQWDLLGTRLSCIAYLSASFWLSHTYTPILYVLLSLPIAQQIASSNNGDGAIQNQSANKLDLPRILLISVASILVIHVLAIRMR